MKPADGESAPSRPLIIPKIERIMLPCYRSFYWSSNGFFLKQNLLSHDQGWTKILSFTVQDSQSCGIDESTPVGELEIKTLQIVSDSSQNWYAIHPSVFSFQTIFSKISVWRFFVDLRLKIHFSWKFLSKTNRFVSQSRPKGENFCCIFSFHEK